MVSGPVDELSAGIVFVAGTTASAFAGVSCSSNLSAFANSFGAKAGSILL